MLAEGENQVLSCHAACLRASEEESQHLVDNTHIPAFEMLIDKKQCQEVTCLFHCCLLGGGAHVLFPLVNDILAEGSQGCGIAQHVLLVWRDVVACQYWKQVYVR